MKNQPGEGKMAQSWNETPRGRCWCPHGPAVGSVGVRGRLQRAAWRQENEKPAQNSTTGSLLVPCLKIPACNVSSLTQLRSVARRHASFIFGVLIDALTRNPGLESIKGGCVNALSNWG